MKNNKEILKFLKIVIKDDIKYDKLLIKLNDLKKFYNLSNNLFIFINKIIIISLSSFFEKYNFILTFIENLLKVDIELKNDLELFFENNKRNTFFENLDDDIIDKLINKSIVFLEKICFSSFDICYLIFINIIKCVKLLKNINDNTVCYFYINLITNCEKIIESKKKNYYLDIIKLINKTTKLIKNL